MYQSQRFDNLLLLIWERGSLLFKGVAVLIDVLCNSDFKNRVAWRNYTA